MVQYIKPSTVIVTNKQGEGHLKITLELNINLNANGIQASISAAGNTPANPDEYYGFEIPTFEDETPEFEFGKKVDNVSG